MPSQIRHGASDAVPFDAIVFDLDGTLWDATATVARAWDAVVRARLPGCRGIDQAVIRSVAGLTHAALSRAVFPDLPEGERERLMQECYATDRAWLRRDGALLYPGVTEGLRALAARYPLAIVSNCERGYIETFYAVTGLGPRFQDAECHGRTGKSKAENLADVVRRQSFARPVYVGDTAGDESAAAEAGVPFIHAAYGFGQPVKRCLSFADFPALTRYLLHPTHAGDGR